MGGASKGGFKGGKQGGGGAAAEDARLRQEDHPRGRGRKREGACNRRDNAGRVVLREERRRAAEGGGVGATAQRQRPE